MKIKNREMANKLKDAFKKAGIELPAKQSGSVEKKSKSKRKSAKSIKATSQEAGRPSLNNPAVSTHSNPVISHEQRRPKPNHKPKKLNDGSPSLAAIRAAYGPRSKNNQGNNATRSQPLEKTSIKPRDGAYFEPNSVFSQKVADNPRVVINEKPCLTQITPSSDVEVQLVIGLDLGTSTTKVVIGDPDHKRFFAVPLSAGSENPYLVSTSIIKDDSNNIIIDTGDSPNILRNIKLDLMEKQDDQSIVYLAGYVAQIIRHSISWFISAHADEYRDMRLFWTMAMGLPVDSARQDELENCFRIAAIAGAQAAISDVSINVGDLELLVYEVQEDLNSLKFEGSVSSFEELGGDPGVVVVVPEIAAQVVGLFRSRRWESNKPISFLMDVGAGTVDSAVFSLVDAFQDGKELAFCAFSCNVCELGVVKLHQERVGWLRKNLPEGLPNQVNVHDYLDSLERFYGALMPVPGKIDDYINHVEIIKGNSNLEPDRRFAKELDENIYQGVLMAAMRKSEGDSAWNGLRTMICGGGARSAYYREFIEKRSDNFSYRLQSEVLEKPNNLDAPGLSSAEYDRLSVAYGLAQGTQWEYRWPEQIEAVSCIEPTREREYVSKDML